MHIFINHIYTTNSIWLIKVLKHTRRIKIKILDLNNSTGKYHKVGFLKFRLSNSELLTIYKEIHILIYEKMFYYYFTI